jgi:pimeloyl-[acyl-carrier protein] methyl ester esterase
MTEIVFVHGWGFDARAWDRVRQGLPDFETEAVDLGFYGRPAGTSANGREPVIAVGHSLGFLWLLHERPFPWRALVSVSGMARFARAPGYAHGVAPRVLDAMIAKLRQAPDEVVAEFFGRCGIDGDVGDGLDESRLGEALIWLKDWDARDEFAAEESPVLALFAEDDAIVPRALSETNFAARANTTVAARADGGHALPVTRAGWCAERIREFVSCL